MVVAPRTVAVELLSVRAELARVIRLGGTVALGVWLYLAVSLDSDDNGRRRLMPYQTVIHTRPAIEQRLFGELKEGLLEAETARASGAWPTIEWLAANGIPPFAPDPTARAMPHRWHLFQSGTIINYVGVPERAGLPAWLLLIQEPEPGVPPDQNFEDEEHHRLLNGTMLHVSTWMRAASPAVEAQFVRVPQAQGWTQVYAVGPGKAIQ